MVDDLERMKLDEIKSKMNTAKFMAAGQAWNLLHSIFWLTTVSKEETFDGAEISAVGTFILRPAAVPVPISSEPPPPPNLLPPPFPASPSSPPPPTSSPTTNFTRPPCGGLFTDSSQFCWLDFFPPLWHVLWCCGCSASLTVLITISCNIKLEMTWLPFSTQSPCFSTFCFSAGF